MRRIIFSVFGTLEVVLAGVLIVILVNVPRNAEVEQGFDRAGKVTAGCEKQVHALRNQVSDLRRPELERVATRLRTQTKAVNEMLQNQRIDFANVEALVRSVDGVVDGLEGWSETLDPDRVGQLGKALRLTADQIDSQVAASTRAADGMEKSAAALEKDARRLAAIIRTAPPDLKALREIYESLGRFDSGLAESAKALKLERADAIKEGFQGMEGALNSTADQVDKLAGYSYPVVKLNGFRPETSMKPFWGEGDKVAENLRKAVGGVQAANQEFDKLSKTLPSLTKSLDESRKVLARTRDAIATALKQQDQIEPLLKDVPASTAELADNLPQITRDMTRVLRDAGKMKDVAVAMRKSGQGIDTAVARWPDLRATMSRSAELLRATQGQLQKVVVQREQYETALRSTSELAAAFSDLLPLFTDQLDARLGEQEYTLSNLEKGMGEVNAALPEVRQTTTGLLTALKWFLGLFALFIGLHGGYVLVESATRASPSTDQDRA